MDERKCTSSPRYLKTMLIDMPCWLPEFGFREADLPVEYMTISITMPIYTKVMIQDWIGPCTLHIHISAAQSQSPSLESKGLVNEFRLSEQMLNPLIIGHFFEVSEYMAIGLLAFLSTADRLAGTLHSRGEGDIRQC